VFAAALLLGARPALADEPRVLVLPFSGSVPGTPDGPARLTQVVARSAGLTGADVVMGQATFADAAALAGCAEETPECFSQVAASLKVDQVVIGDVQPTSDGRSVAITLKIFQDGAIREKAVTLPATSMDDLVKRLAREAPALFVPGDETSAPPPEPAPGPELTPDPRPAPAPERPASSSRPRTGALPWILVASGAAIAGAGGGFLFAAGKKQDEVDGAPISDADDFERLAALEDKGDNYTKIGNGLLIAGSAVLVTGAVLVVMRGMAGGDDEPETSAVSVGATPIEGGFGIAVARPW
jgi:hypothetical protein